MVLRRGRAFIVCGGSVGVRPRRLRKVAAAPRTSYSVIADVLVKLGFKPLVP